MTTELKNFLEIPYDQLEELNLEAKEKVQKRTPDEELMNYYLKYLHDEKRIKAVTVCFSDLEGKLHMLDYDAAGFSVMRLILKTSERTKSTNLAGENARASRAINE